MPGGGTSNQIASITNSVAGKYDYTYDSKGNITKIVNGNDVTTYQYDEAGQLVKENDTQIIYDKGGNIVQKGHMEFEYDSVWADKLISVDGNSVDYDDIGNPISFGGNTLIWHGRRMTNYNDFAYTYSESGLRTSKTVDGVTTHYVWVGDKLLGQYDENHVIYFSNIGLNVNGVQYFYVKNLQGDVVQIVDESGENVAEYVYDAWGNVVESSGALAEINPIRYRGYYYDVETQMYYNQQRYYVPEWARWLNADILFYTNEVSENNLFVYCRNDPVNRIDIDGKKSTTFITKSEMEERLKNNKITKKTSSLLN